MKKYISILFLLISLQSLGQSIEYNGKKVILPTGISKDTLSTIKNLRDSLAILKAIIDTKSDKSNPSFSGIIKINTDTIATKADVRTFSGVSSINVSGLDYPNDSVAIAGGGLFRWEWYRTGNIIKSVINDLWLNYYTGMFYVKTNKKGVKIKALNYGGLGNFNWTAYWQQLDKADVNKYSGANTYTVLHPFGDNSEKFTAFSFQNYSQVQELQLDSVKDYFNTNLFTNLFLLQIQNSIVPDINVNIPSLKTLNLFTNTSAWVDFGVLPSGITTINISGNSGFTYARTANTPTSVTTFTLTYNGLTTTDINTILTALNGIAFTSPVTIDLRQGGAAPPSGAGSTAKTSLISKGNTVITD